MENFDFCTPTHVVFGSGSIASLRELLNKKDKIMITYGGGSIKKNGVYGQVVTALNDFNFIEFGGIEPNPKFETCMKAVELARRENVTFLLSVGGGSTLDGTKFIAAAIKYKGDPWEIVTGEGGIEDAVPLGDVITLPATGSEMNAGAVISRISTGEKLPMFSPLVIPKFSIIDPSVTFSLPVKQTVNGIVDTFVHVMEQYVTKDINTPVQDLSALAVIRTLLEESPKVLTDPKNYNVRANLFWCATLGLNGWLGLGMIQDWSTHMIGHELTAFYGIDHGQSLAVVMPRVWRFKFQEKKGKLAKYAREAWKIEETNDTKAAEFAIQKTVEFFNALGMKTNLADYGINPNEAAQKVRDRFNARNVHFGEDEDIDGNAAYKILCNC